MKGLWKKCLEDYEEYEPEEKGKNHQWATKVLGRAKQTMG
jgi:hypothetical protein